MAARRRQYQMPRVRLGCLEAVLHLQACAVDEGGSSLELCVAVACCALRAAAPLQELVLLEKEKELLEKEQTVAVLREEVGARRGRPGGRAAVHGLVL